VLTFKIYNFKGSMNKHLKTKLQLTSIGYVFALLNSYLAMNGRPLEGIFFGIIACCFFLKSLTTKDS
jgi:hypothetical protein